MVLIWKTLSPFHPKLYAKFGWNRPNGSAEDFKILSMYFCYFVIISHWKRAWPFIFTQGCLVPSLVEIGPVVLEKKFFFKISSVYFRYLVITTPWKRAWPFILTNLNPLYPRMLCTKFGWNWPSGSWEEDF